MQGELWKQVSKLEVPRDDAGLITGETHECANQGARVAQARRGGRDFQAESVGGV